MAKYRIHRMKESARQNFRWSPHVSGQVTVKPRDYDAAGEIEALNEYAAWGELQGSERPLLVGDLLERCSETQQETAPEMSLEPRAQNATESALENGSGNVGSGSSTVDVHVQAGELRICKYVGFEPAQWLQPGVAAQREGIPAASGPAAGALKEQEPVHTA